MLPNLYLQANVTSRPTVPTQRDVWVSQAYQLVSATQLMVTPGDFLTSAENIRMTGPNLCSCKDQKLFWKVSLWRINLFVFNRNEIILLSNVWQVIKYYLGIYLFFPVTDLALFGYNRGSSGLSYISSEALSVKRGRDGCISWCQEFKGFTLARPKTREALDEIRGCKFRTKIMLHQQNTSIINFNVPLKLFWMLLQVNKGIIFSQYIQLVEFPER